LLRLLLILTSSSTSDRRTVHVKYIFLPRDVDKDRWDFRRTSDEHEVATCTGIGVCLCFCNECFQGIGIDVFRLGDYLSQINVILA